MHTLEPFLLLLSSVFVPLYGVILGRLGTGAAPVPLGTPPRGPGRGRHLDRRHRDLPRLRGLGAAVGLGAADPGRHLRAGLVTRPAPAGGPLGTGAKPWLRGP